MRKIIGLTFYSSLQFVVLIFSAEVSAESNKIIEVNYKRNITVYWNIPTFQCDSHRINFADLAKKYNILQNKNDRFRGEDIVILYDLGNFPAILTQGNKTILRNGGVPQQGSLSLHLKTTEEIIDQLIPGKEFSGIGIIDFESWRPIFRQNFGSLRPYKDLSVKIEKQNHPFWPTPWIENEAIHRFEQYARIFMEQTIKFVKKLRPNAKWGYYAYPYCFNRAQRACPKEVLPENDQIKWLSDIQDNFYPSVYLTESDVTRHKVEMIEGRIAETLRFKGTSNRKKILPYYWYKYHSGNKFLSKDDAFNTLTVLGALQIDGIIIWGSSNDVNTKEKCLALYRYIDNVLGPILINSIY